MENAIHLLLSFLVVCVALPTMAFVIIALMKRL